MLPFVGRTDATMLQCDVALMRFEKYCFSLGVPVLPVAMVVINPWPLKSRPRARPCPRPRLTCQRH